ncbi:alkaline phosphatase family protein [Pelagibius litoralis]|uniref:Alkaline phosphatase family protein n=1 Tax=Pelagibius litoralis TaxID=374515 RepID=A0A967EYN4_9PROT|nr:alkaline phosphatase family protein [Pelagibius litoralis]NIA69829.1 alkaline phosphatase family protein [Pelagibius litoralis]
MAEAPNILLITADQWRGDCLGPAGHPVLRTPAIDDLSARGVTFARHYAQAAPCSPGRASLYTGLYQMNHRVLRNGTPLDARHDNIALALQRRGYEPRLFGYTDQSIDPRTTTPDDPRLNSYEGVLPGFTAEAKLTEDNKPWFDWMTARGHDLPEDPWALFLPPEGRPRFPTTAPPRFSQDETETAFLTDAFVDWLSEQPKDGPWCAHVSFLRPHPPFVVPEPFNTLYDPASGPAFRRAVDPATEAAQHPYLAYWLDQAKAAGFCFVEDGESLLTDWPEEAFRNVRATYWGMISEVDRQIGRLTAALQARGAWDDTIIVLTSDHGEMMGDHWTLGKFGYFDQAYHIPLIVRDPRHPEGFGGRVSDFTEAVDVMPTLVELSGASRDGPADGRSLSPFVHGERPVDWRREAHWEFDFREVTGGGAQGALGLELDDCSLAVIRDERYKYVHFTGLPPLLFDLQEDPDELRNLADDADYLAPRLAMAEKLLAWRSRYLDRRLTGIALTPDGPLEARR